MIPLRFLWACAIACLLNMPAVGAKPAQPEPVDLSAVYSVIGDAPAAPDAFWVASPEGPPIANPAIKGEPFAPFMPSPKAIWSPIGSTPNPLVNGGGTTIGAGIASEGAGPFTNRTDCVATRAAWGPTSTLRLVYAWYTDDEQPIPNGGTIKASVRLKDGSVFQATFDGGATSHTFSANATGANAIAVTDPIKLTNKRIAQNDLFWTLSYVSVANSTDTIPGGIRLMSNTSRENQTLLGEWAHSGDKTAGASYSGTNTNYAYSPSVILGVDTKPHVSIGAIGDSRQTGTGDTAFRKNSGGPIVRWATGQTGLVWSQTANPLYPTGCFSKPGSTLASLASAATFDIRFRLSLYFTTIICNSDVNDSGTSTPAQLKANYLALIKRYSDLGRNFIVVPMGPRNFSSDGWVTVRTNKTTVTTGASSTTQTVGSTTGISAGDSIFFETSQTSRVVSSVTDSTHLVLTATISTTTGETVGIGQYLKNGSPSGAATIHDWDATVRAWENDSSASGLLEQAVSNGTPRGLIHVWNIYKDVSCLSNGTPDPLGEYWLPDANSGTPVKTGTVDSSSGATNNTLIDTVVLSAVTINQYTGYVIKLTSGTYNGTTSGIQYNTPANNRAVTEGFPDIPAVGTTWKMYLTYSTDGTHPSSKASNVMTSSSAIVLADVK